MKKPYETIILLGGLLALLTTNVITYLELREARKAAKDTEVHYNAAVSKIDSSLAIAHVQLDSLLAGGKDSVIIYQKRIIERTIKEVQGAKPHNRPDSLVQSLNNLLK